MIINRWDWSFEPEVGRRWNIRCQNAKVFFGERLLIVVILLLFLHVVAYDAASYILRIYIHWSYFDSFTFEHYLLLLFQEWRSISYLSCCKFPWLLLFIYFFSSCYKYFIIFLRLLHSLSLIRGTSWMPVQIQQTWLT